MRNECYLEGDCFCWWWGFPALCSECHTHRLASSPAPPCLTARPNPHLCISFAGETAPTPRAFLLSCSAASPPHAFANKGTSNHQDRPPNSELKDCTWVMNVPPPQFFPVSMRQPVGFSSAWILLYLLLSNCCLPLDTYTSYHNLLWRLTQLG